MVRFLTLQSVCISIKSFIRYLDAGVLRWLSWDGASMSISLKALTSEEIYHHLKTVLLQ